MAFNFDLCATAQRSGDTGRPTPAARWDQEYREGRWQHLDSPEELAHYRAVADAIARFADRPTILDAGCGHGRLAALLAAGSFQSYLGVDCSGEAVERAGRLAGARMRFRVADMDRWRPRRRYGVIVFCESLNYARHPVATLRGYAAALAPGGIVVVSLYGHPNHERIWTNAAAHFRTLHAAVVREGGSRCWHVRVLQPAACGGESVAALDRGTTFALECGCAAAGIAEGGECGGS